MPGSLQDTAHILRHHSIEVCQVVHVNVRVVKCAALTTRTVEMAKACDGLAPRFHPRRLWDRLSVFNCGHWLAMRLRRTCRVCGPPFPAELA